MSVAAGTEIVTGGSLAPEQTKVQETAHGTGRAGTTQGSQSSVMQGAESFRTGWQSLLASLGSSVEGSGQIAAEASPGTTSAGSSPEESAGKSSVATSTLPAGTLLSLLQETKVGSQETDATAKSLSTGVQSGTSVVRKTGDAVLSTSTKTATTKTDEKKSATDSKTGSSNSASSSSTSTVKTDDLTAGSMAGVLPSAIPSDAMIPLVPATVSPVACTSTSASVSDEKAQSVQVVDSLADLPTGISATSLGVSKQVTAAAQGTAKESETSAKQDQILPALSQAKTSVASEGASRSVAIRTQNGSSLETSASDLNQTQMAVSSQNASQTLVQSPSMGSKQKGNQAADVVADSASVATSTSSTAALSDTDALNRLPVAANAAAQSGQLPIASKTDAAGVGKSSPSGTLRSAREAGNSAATQQGIHLTEGQSSGTVVDASAVTREVISAHGAASTASGSSGTSTDATTGSTSDKTFAALDADSATGKPTWVHTGAQRAEAGFQDPSLGWVSVRANVGGGGVHAELVAGSNDAAQVLGTHMAGLNAYLAEHHTSVGTLTLSSSESGWTGSSSNTGTGQQTGQGTAQGADTGSSSSSSQAAILPVAASSELPAWSGALDGSAQLVRPQGGHISVIA